MGGHLDGFKDTQRAASIDHFFRGEPEISRPNQVWCSDITYIPVQHGFLYPVEIMDWATGNPHGIFGTLVSLSWLFKHVAIKSLGVEALRLLGLR